jgi:hypothetical protein
MPINNLKQFRKIIYSWIKWIVDLYEK